LKAPEIFPEGVKIRGITLSSLEFDVVIRVQNPNIVGITLREFPFLLLVRTGDGEREVANGNTGNVLIRARHNTVLTVPLTCRNTELIKAVSAFITNSEIEVTIKGNAIVEAVITGWSVPVENTVTVTLGQVKDALYGKNGDKPSVPE